MDVKKRFQSASIPGEAMRKKWGARFASKDRFSFQTWLRFGFALLLVLAIPSGVFYFQQEPAQNQGEIGATITQSAGMDSILAAECMDRESLSNSVDYILEGRVINVKFEADSTYSEIEIENYVKGEPFSGDVLQIVTLGGEGMWVEDQAIFHEDTRVRIYLKEINGQFVIFCGDYGLAEISGDLSYRVSEGCNMEGPGDPVPESIHLFQDGDSIQFEQMVQLPLTDGQRNFKLNYNQSGHNIEIRENFEAGGEPPTGSVCSTFVWGRVDDLEEGSYTIQFIFEDQDSGEERVLVEEEFTVAN